MSHELRNCEVDMKQAIRNMKLDPKPFKDDIERSLDAAGRLFSNHLKEIRLLFHQGHYDQAIEELEKVRFNL